MATVMTSHSSAPPLPSRNPGQTSRPIHAQQGQSRLVSNQNSRQRSQSDTNPPSLPPVSKRRATEKQRGVDIKSGGSPRGHDGNPPPPVPQRGANGNEEPRGINKRSFETKSFVNRHTARAFSNPDNPPPKSDKTQPPPPPSTKTLPRQKMRDVYDAEQREERPNQYAKHRDTQSDLPPGRPPKSGPGNSAIHDLERRFTFHDVSDFPDPEPLRIFKKAFPSLSQSIRRSPDPTPSGTKTKEHPGYL